MTKKEYERSLCKYPAALTAAEISEILRASIKTVYKLIRENRIAKSHLVNYLRQLDKSDSHPKVYFLEKIQDNLWTCRVACDIVCVGGKPQIKKGVMTNENTKHPCGKHSN